MINSLFRIGTQMNPEVDYMHDAFRIPKLALHNMADSKIAQDALNAFNGRCNTCGEFGHKA